MPAQRTKPSLGPHSLELLYSKYGPAKLHASCSPSLIPTATTTSTTTTTTKPTTTSSSTPVMPGTLQRKRHRRPPPPPVLKGPELGDLSQLGCGLSKLERVHLLLDLTPNTGRSSRQLMKSRSQPGSAPLNPAFSVPDPAVCSECCQIHKPTEGQSKLKDLKSKLRLVAPRSLPDKPPSSHTDSSSPTVQQRQPPSQHVVPLPLLHIRFQQQSRSGSRDFPAVQDAAGQALRRMFFPQNNNRSSVAVWNFKTSRGGSQPARSRDLLESTDASSRFLTSAGMAAPSLGWRERYGKDSISTYDSDRMDSEQFEYVFDQFSSLSSEESESCTTITPESDTATFSARAQRPSTIDTVATRQRLSHSWSSRSRRLSPISATGHGRAPASRGSSTVTPQHRARASRESWPPHFTVIPSWPAVDDPFRFQYLGQGVQRDIVRHLQLRSGRGGSKKLGKARDSVEAEQTPQLQPQDVQPVLPQKLEIVLPTHTECHLCKTYECEHTITPRQTHTTARSTRPLSLSAQSSRASQGRPDTVHCSKNSAIGPAVNGDSDPVPWCVEERCVAQGNEVTFDRGHYTAQNAVN